MFDAILAITAIVIIFLGFRLIKKFREMSSWNDEDAVVGGKGKAALPSELRELKIDEPPDDSMNRLDSRGDAGASGTITPPGKN
jgi:hypothetical protein